MNSRSSFASGHNNHDDKFPTKSCWKADQGNKCDENRTHLESDDNLSNRRNVFLINPDEVFGMHNHITNIILPRWRDDIAGEMKPLAIRNWLYDLHDGDDYRWETCSKTAGIMSLVFDFVDHNEIYSIRNLMEKVTIPASEEEHPALRLLTPEEVFSLMERLPSPVNIAVLFVAANGVRISECLGLRWRHVLWDENKISIEQVFRRGEIVNRT